MDIHLINSSNFDSKLKNNYSNIDFGTIFFRYYFLLSELHILDPIFNKHLSPCISDMPNSNQILRVIKENPFLNDLLFIYTKSDTLLKLNRELGGDFSYYYLRAQGNFSKDLLVKKN